MELRHERDCAEDRMGGSSSTVRQLTLRFFTTQVDLYDDCSYDNKNQLSGDNITG